MADRKKSLGISLRSKRRRDSDPSEEDRVRSRQRTDTDPGHSRHRSHSTGARHPRPTVQRATLSSDEELYTVADSGIERSRGFLFPGHNYLGPGNPEYNGPPTNRVDAAAQHHDQEYGRVSQEFQTTGNKEKAFQAIQQADETFLSEISDIEPGSYTEFFGKIAGQIGIGAKKSVEGLLHSTVYPRLKLDTDMDVVDGPEGSNNVYNIPQSQATSSVISLGPGVKPPHTTKWEFSKHFEMSFESHLFEYTKSAATDQAKGETKIKAFIHSLPWEKLYFYLTEREYNTILNSFHTAFVESVTIKIYNLGVTTDVLQGSNSVNIKSVSPNHYLGIWRGFEKHGPVELGSNITPAFLYGSTINDLPDKSSFAKTDKGKIGAVSEMKNVDNRIVYKKITSTYDKDQRKSVSLGEANIHLPPAFEMASLKVNANSSIGLIYETTYKPVDGLFHNRSFAFHNASVVQHRPYEVNVNLDDTGSISDATYIISGTSKSDYVKYTEATIDNMFFRSLRKNDALGFVDGFGIGLFPKRSKDDKNVEANVEIAIETEIQIKAEAFGGSVLSSGSAGYAQSNPNRIYFIHKNKKFGNAYASDGLPTLGNLS